jgi:hypothetical protein
MGFLIVRPYDITDTQFVSSNVTEDDYPEWDIATSYDLGDRVIVVDTNIHNVYESLIAGTGTNTGNDPLDDQQWPDGTPVNWILVSVTNRWKMFDNQNSSQTTNADSIEAELMFTQRPNSVALLNVDCATAQVIQYDAMAVEVYNQTETMIENSGVPSYYNWLFQQIQKKTDVLFENLIPVSGCTIEVILTNTGGTVLCGTCLVGYAEDFGDTLLGAGVGIQDFSVKQRNDFGDFRILERAFNREGEFTVMVDNGNLDRLQNLLASRRATATLYIGSTVYRCTYIYGFFTDMQSVITYPEQSLLNIDITGLT